MKNQKLALLGLLLALCLLVEIIPPPVVVYGAGPNTLAESSKEPDRSVVIPSRASPSDSLENLNFLQEDFVIQGVTNRQDYYFELSPGRQLQKGSYFLLYYGHSQTLLPQKSTITVLLDDIPLGSKFLNADNADHASWKIEFPDPNQKPGFHKISILTHMEASSNLCEDQNNTANWTLFHKESLIHLSFRNSYDSPDLQYYPSPFLEVGSADPLKTIFILPDSATEGQVKALTQLSAFFAGLMPSALMEFKVYKESDLSDTLLNSSHQIWLGAAKDWNGAGQRLLQAADPGAAADGAVRVMQSPWNGTHTALWIAGDDTKLKQAVHVLTTKGLYGQLSGAFWEVKQENSAETLTPSDNKTESNKVTLADMGYKDLVIESPLVGSARVSYSIPAEWDVYKGATLKLQFSHTKTLNYAQSLMTVKVNNTPLSSKYLTEETSDFGSLEVDIPQDILKAGILNIDIGFQFSSSKESCAGNSQIGNWSVISNKSSLSYAYRPNKNLDFSSLPYPFVSRGAWNQVAVYTESNPSSEVLSLLASACGYLGRSAAAASEFEVVKAPSAVPAGKNIIYVGRTKELPALLNETANIPVKIEQGVPSSQHPHVELVSSGADRTGVMEMYRLDSNLHFAMVMTAKDNETLKRMNTLMNQPEQRSKMTGQVVLIDPANRIHSFKLEQPADGPSKFDQALELLTPNNKNVLSRFFIIIGSAVLLILVSLSVWLFRRRRG